MNTTEPQYEIFNSEIIDFENDIKNIDIRIDKVNKNIILLQANIDRVTKLILNSNTTDKSMFYKIQTEALKTITLLNNNYQQLLDLKFKYRTQKSEYKLKTARYIDIELKKLEQSSQSDEMSYMSVLKALNNLSANITTNKEEDESVGLNLDYEKDEMI